MDSEQDMQIALAWYRPEEWDDIKLICPDVHDTYEEWLASAQNTIDALGSPLKDNVVKVVLTASELRKWKRATGRKVDAKVRSQLAVKRARKIATAHNKPTHEPDLGSGNPR
ncbi:hypothetical protein SSBR45G_01300 [Bradyrhizobium sp. SSBR45G]|uniref:hypothetical protein n=1 Tax=unclassified Bradyrhizobium TaxID=2631580 RepID=UPI0023428E9F|nr:MULTISPECIES: hypothetical protein [unclassified Bradyrhizobium]GLH75222.1 hypothetical protein SSBR45G_01300 [Bradyrhizobium sp. SSBR45G]GLH82991.1 hypothetical protein SSBR45R_04510 [Bradyrhizobium sp. SSBR45R]